MIHTFPDSKLHAADPRVTAISDPKHISISGNTVTVMTGDDIPPPPPPQEKTYAEKEVVTLLKTAGKTDAEAKAMLTAEPVVEK